MTALAIDERPRPLELRDQTPSEGDDGKRLADWVLKADLQLRDTAQDWRTYVNSAIAEIHAACSVANWNGPDSVAINDMVLGRALKVTDLLYYYVPYATPAPELVPGADGEVAMTWALNPNQVFSISIGNHGMLNFAGRLGEGVEPHDAVPFSSTDSAAIERLASYISQLYR
jgi:hypothetical protein